MRIVHFVWEFPPRIIGGLGTFASEFTRQLVIKGHEVTVFTMNEGNRYITTGNWKGVEVHRPKLCDFSGLYPAFVGDELMSWGESLGFFADVMTYNMLSTTKFVNTIMGGDGRTFDLAHAHDWLGIVAGVATKTNAGLPLVFHVHSTERGRSRGIGSRTVETLEHIGAKRADVVVTVSNAMKNEVVTLGMAPPEKVQVCWNGVDTAKYDPGKADEKQVEGLRSYYNIEEGDRVVLFVGRLVSVKGPDKLVEAMPDILSAHPRTKLVVLGQGDLYKPLKELVSKLGLTKHVKLRNEFVPETERIAHYAMADVCVFPSTYEPFGIVCTEAMSMGKPVVVGASGTNGLKEQVIPKGAGKCGTHVDGSDSGDIAWGVKDAFSSDDGLRRMGSNARSRAIEHFEWGRVVDQMINIYSTCIDVPR